MRTAGRAVHHRETLAIADAKGGTDFAIVRRIATPEEIDTMHGAGTSNGGTDPGTAWAYGAVARAPHAGEALPEEGERAIEMLAQAWAKAIMGAEMGGTRGGDRAACQDCEWQGSVEDVAPLRDAAERVGPGEEMPAGECPECGASAMVESEQRTEQETERRSNA